MITDLLVGFGLGNDLQGLRPGVAMRGLADVHGPPHDLGRTSRRRRWPHLFAYGSVEFTGCLCRLVTYVSVPLWRGQVILPDGLAVACRIPEKAMLTALAAAECEVTRLPGSRAFVTGAGIAFLFEDDAAGESVLYGASSRFHRHVCVTAAEAAVRFPDDFPVEVPAGG